MSASANLPLPVSVYSLGVCEKTQDAFTANKWAVPHNLTWLPMTMELNARIEAFLDGSPFAVVGASPDRSKYGNKVLRVYQQNGLTVYPVNPRLEEVEGLTAYPDLASLPEAVHGVSIITPPAVTERVVEEAVAAGIRHLWMQPGAESDLAIERAGSLGLNLIAGGPCILVTLRYRETS